MANITYTFLEMQDKLSSLLGDENTGTGNQFPLAQRQKELNDAEIQFAIDAKDLPEYTTNTVSGMEISVPSDWIKTHILLVNSELITSDREIALSDLGRFKNWQGDDPFYYFWKFSDTWKIKFLGNSGNINGKTYELFYFKRPSTLLENDSDTSVHDLEFRPAIVYKAAAELLLQVGQTQKAGVYMQVYRDYVSDASSRFNDNVLTYERPKPDLNYFSSSAQTDMAGT